MSAWPPNEARTGSSWHTEAMGWLDKIMFWRKPNHESIIEHVEGYEVDGCFTLPGARLPDIEPVGGTNEERDDNC